MKLTPLGKVIIVLALLVAAFFAVRRFAPGLKNWATGGKNGPAKTEAVSKDDFSALGNAPADPERNKGSEGVSPSTSLGGSGKLDRPLVVAINTWAGHSPGIVFNGGLDPNPGSSYTKKYGLDVKFVLHRRPGRQARGLPQGRRRHHVGHGRQLGARGLDPRRAEPEGQVDHHAGLVARRRRHRLARLHQVDRGPEGAQGRLHPVHAVALPAPLPARPVGPVARRTGRRSRRTSSSPRTRRPPPPPFKAKQVDAAVTWEPDLSGAVEARGDEAHVLVSTTAATNIIADTLVRAAGRDRPGPDTVRDFVHGWFDGIDMIKNDPPGLLRPGRQGPEARLRTRSPACSRD